MKNLAISDKYIFRLYRDGKTARYISKIAKCSIATITARIRLMGGVIRKPDALVQSLVGQRSGSLVAVEVVKVGVFSKLQCICDCGKSKLVQTHAFRMKQLTSCGCRLTVNKRHEKGFGGISGTFWSRVRHAATNRTDPAKRQFDITIQQAWKLFLKQKGKCALSGLELYIVKNANEYDNGMCTASIDRIDSRKGYVRGNIQWVHKDINKIKTDLDQFYFISLCNRVSTFCR